MGVEWNHNEPDRPHNAAYTGSAGRQVSEPRELNAAGQVAGHSQRFTGENTDNGGDAWVWNRAATVQIGFTGGVYTGSAGISSASCGSRMMMGVWLDTRTTTPA